MFFIDVSTGMATLKTGGASAVVPQGTKLILPHEMLTANGTAQSVIGASASPLSSGHSTTTTLLISNNHHFYHNASFHNSSSLFNTNSNSSSCSTTNNSNSHDITSHHLRPNSATAVVSNAPSFTSGNIFFQNHASSPVVAATTLGLGHQNYLLVGSNSSSNTHNNISATNAAIITPNHTSTFNAPPSSSSSSSITTIPTTNHNSTTIMNNKMHTTATTANTTTTLLPASSAKVEKEAELETEDTTDVTHQPETSVTALESSEPVEEDPEIDIVINNVVCSFSVRCHLNLRSIALNGHNVEFRRENGMVTMKLRKPYTTASIWSSGKITCTGATSEDNAKVAARRYARMLQKLGFRVRFNNFRVVNVLGTCSMPWAIKITHFSERYRKEASYEPELHPGVTYKLKEPKATLKIFSTGSITVTAASVSFVQQAIEHIYPLVYEFRKKRTPDEEKTVKAHLQNSTPFDPNDLIEVDEDFEEGVPVEVESSLQPPKKRRRPAGKAANDPQEDIMQVSDVEPDLDDSDDDL